MIPAEQIAEWERLEREAPTEVWIYSPDDEGDSMGWIVIASGSEAGAPAFAVLGDSAIQADRAAIAAAARTALPPSGRNW